MKKETKERFLDMLDFYLPTITLFVGIAIGAVSTVFIPWISRVLGII